MYLKLACIALFSLCLLSCVPSASETEARYARKVQETHGGELKVRLSDGTRVDLLTETHAFKVEKSHDWKEAVGQSLHYASLTGKKAGIILVMEKRTAHRHLEDLEALIALYELPIDVLKIQADITIEQ